MIYYEKDYYAVPETGAENEIAAMPKPVPKIKLDENELEMAKMLIENMTKPFVAEDYREEYQARLREAIILSTETNDTDGHIYYLHNVSDGTRGRMGTRLTKMGCGFRSIKG